MLLGHLVLSAAISLRELPCLCGLVLVHCHGVASSITCQRTMEASVLRREPELALAMEQKKPRFSNSVGFDGFRLNYSVAVKTLAILCPTTRDSWRLTGKNLLWNPKPCHARAKTSKMRGTGTRLPRTGSGDGVGSTKFSTCLPAARMATTVLYSPKSGSDSRQGCITSMFHQPGLV